MRTWDECWDEVVAAIRSAKSKEEASLWVSEIRGSPCSWNAIDVAARRRGIPGAFYQIGTLTEKKEPPGAAYFWGRGAEEAVKPLINSVVEAAKLPHPFVRVTSGDYVRRPGRKHLIIPDTQCKPGVPLDHFTWIGRYIADKQPDVVIHLGDHWDMPSLSSYDSAAKKARRGTIVLSDIDAGNVALQMLHEAMGGFEPEEKILLEGNHDGFAPQGRIGRHNDENQITEGLIHLDQFADKALGWTRVPFLQSVDVDGILYSHLHPFSARGTVTAGAQRRGASSAAAQLRALMQSCTAGHKQGLETYMHYTPQRTMRSVIAGSCYLHDEEYMEPGNRHWRGILVKHDVSPSNPNHYDLMEVSLDFLRRKYG